jgi:hypothetical protein
VSSPKTGPSAIALALALVAAGCGHTIIDKPVTRQGDSWDLILRKLTDGPNQYGTAGRTYYPGEGSRFIWAHITLHNNQPVARKFNFDRCGLDDGDSQVVPAKIDIDAIITGEVNREPELSPDETITRKLIFVYPENRSPTQLTCLPMVIPLPQF